MNDYSEIITEIDKAMKVLRESLPDKNWNDSVAAFLHIMTWAGKGFDLSDNNLKLECHVVQTDK